MARTVSRPDATVTRSLDTLIRRCPACGGPLWVKYRKRRTVTTLSGLLRLDLAVRRCQTETCARYRQFYRPEEEGAVVLPGSETGLDVIALVGALRYAEHQSVPEIHRALVGRSVAVCERTVTHLLDRYDELVALVSQDRAALCARLEPQQRLVLAIDGLQPDVGHEVLWVVREVLSGEVLLARSLLSSCSAELGPLLTEAIAGLDLPVVGVVSDGQTSIRKAVAAALPDVAHQLCHFHYLRFAADGVYCADRAAKKTLKKHVRGVRPLERAVEARLATEAAEDEATLGYCAAVRSALTRPAEAGRTTGAHRWRRAGSSSTVG
jgi:hypothetical protein